MSETQPFAVRAELHPVVWRSSMRTHPAFLPTGRFTGGGMAHWLLRERMAEHNEDGRERQERIKKEEHRPEQTTGYGESASDRTEERVRGSEKPPR
jgi:hypothetical protein